MLLSLDGITTARDPRFRRSLLNGVTLDVAPGEFVTVSGRPRSGRSTLLRIAGGLSQCEDGTVSFGGVRSDPRRRSITPGIALARTGFNPLSGTTAHDQILAVASSHLRRLRAARRATDAVISRVGLPDPSLSIAELQPHERARLALARALAIQPRLLLVDDLLFEVSTPSQRDSLEDLLLSLVADEGTAILAAVTQGLPGVTRALTLTGGTVSGDATPLPAPVVRLASVRR